MNNGFVVLLGTFVPLGAALVVACSSAATRGPPDVRDGTAAATAPPPPPPPDAATRAGPGGYGTPCRNAGGGIRMHRHVQPLRGGRGRMSARKACSSGGPARCFGGLSEAPTTGLCTRRPSAVAPAGHDLPWLLTSLRWIRIIEAVTKTLEQHAEQSLAGPPGAARHPAVRRAGDPEGTAAGDIQRSSRSLHRREPHLDRSRRPASSPRGATDVHLLRAEYEQLRHVDGLLVGRLLRIAGKGARSVAERRLSARIFDFLET